jgi:hypothetical protein
MQFAFSTKYLMNSSWRHSNIASKGGSSTATAKAEARVKNRAGRLSDQLYSAVIVGPYKGSTVRDVKVTEVEFNEIFRKFGISLL